jgi:CDP-paratose 2-epimerase
MTAEVLITGGAGFVGTNLAARMLASGGRVRILDSLARAGSEENIAWLRDRFSQDLDFRQEDVRDPKAVSRALQGVGHVVHLAAQVAVTRSLINPAFDFDVNALGTLNLLEAIRRMPKPASLLFASTNKVYGVLQDLPLQAAGERYAPVDARVRKRGIDESRPLDFHSPYGCSKGAAEQYVLDYSRSFGLRTVVFRMSCIYGPHQHGNEDQGWVAHLIRSVMARAPVTIYGDGKQVRDVLFVDDLIDAFGLAQRHIDELAGQAFNIGGGANNTLSLLELLHRLDEFLGQHGVTKFEQWRVGDQRYYVSDTARFSMATGWKPRVSVTQGINALCEWLKPSQSRGGTRQLDSTGLPGAAIEIRG